ncbi:MAG: transposase [Akkermansiaceae bacterium]|nr:transposase [Akkermansiaceae bacterium]
MRQIDKDARITIKNKKMLCGYKLHSKVDIDSKCIVKMKVTPANEADNMHFVELLDESTDKVMYADKGYVWKHEGKYEVWDNKMRRPTSLTISTLPVRPRV